MHKLKPGKTPRNLVCWKANNFICRILLSVGHVPVLGHPDGTEGALTSGFSEREAEGSGVLPALSSAGHSARSLLVLPCGGGKAAGTGRRPAGPHLHLRRLVAVVVLFPKLPVDAAPVALLGPYEVAAIQVGRETIAVPPPPL